MDPSAHVLPAPRKDLSKVSKRRPARKPTASAMDVEMLLASLNEDDAANVAPTTTAPVVNYYTYAPSFKPRPWEPRLLLRQAYKVAAEAFAVVGLECVSDYGPSVYLVNGDVHAGLTFEDIIGLRSSNVVTAVDRYFVEGMGFCTLYLDSVCVEPTSDGGNVSVRNFRRTVDTPTTAAPQSPPLLLTTGGWTALKRLFDCIESYRSLCAEWSPVVRQLVLRYGRYFTRRYKSLLTSRNGPQLNPDLVNHIKADLPSFLHDLDEQRLKVAASADDDYVDDWTFSSTPTSSWIDAEVRRYCVTTLVDTVLDNLKYCVKP